jgi:hypothetical protein
MPGQPHLHAVQYCHQLFCHRRLLPSYASRSTLAKFRRTLFVMSLRGTADTSHADAGLNLRCGGFAMGKSQRTC